MNIAAIAKELSSNRLLGVGESSHGTHEFFDFKSKLLQELVRSHRFNTLFFEDSPVACQGINQFIETGKGNLNELMRKLYPVWQTREFKELLISLRDMNTVGVVRFIGFDIDQTSEDLQKRDELMAGNINKYIEANSDTKALIWAHNSHIQTKGSDFNPKPTGLFLRENFGQEYFALALLFGKGKVSATRLEADTSAGKNRTLTPIDIKSVPTEIVESSLDNLYKQQVFLTRDQIAEMNLGQQTLVRSIGWGFVPELANEMVEQTDIKNAFDALLYFPESTASYSLTYS
jgi:erythromycin esterase-like protein